MVHVKPLLDVLMNRMPSRRPVWLMRQAGRYLPEYREVRSRAGSFLDLCFNPELAYEVTLQPLRRFDLDAAILFSDILVVPQAMGLALDFREGEGPVLETVSDAHGVRSLKVAGRFEAFDKVAETVSRVARDLRPEKTLIGFCGAPWTVASYMIEGGSSKRAKALKVAVDAPPWFGDLIDRLVDVSVTYLKQQVAAGAQVLQIFDSWAGDIPPILRKRWVIDPIARIVSGVRQSYPGIPVIVFARGAGGGHGEVAAGTFASAVSVEQECDLQSLLGSLPLNVAIQGNLDPALLLDSSQVLQENVRRICGEVPMARHIFNLGHGITPQTDPGAVADLVATIRQHDGAA